MPNLQNKTFLLLIALLLGACGKPMTDSLSETDLAKHNRAIGLMGQYQYEAARAELVGLVNNNPDNIQLQVDLSIATLNRQQQGDESAALAQLDTVLRRSPNNLRAHYISGLLKLNAGETTQATTHFKRVLKSNPEDAYASYYLALTLAQLGQTEAALGWYEKTIELDPYLRSGYYGAFQTLRKLGQTERAREMLDQYQKMATNPRSRQAEFKYTRMGSKAELGALDKTEPTIAAIPDGALFKEAKVLLDSLGFKTSQPHPNLTSADINNDGTLDIFIANSHPGSSRPNRILWGQANGDFIPEANHPLTEISAITAPLWGDIDNDGLLDLYLGRNGPNQHWRQSAPGIWENITSPITANENWNTRDGALFDADHDGDLDVFLVNSDGPNELLNNNLNGTFRALAQELGIQGSGSGSRSVLLADLDRDRDTDIMVINDHDDHEVYLNELLWNYKPAPGFSDFSATPAVAAVAQDRDADGIPEIYALSATGQLSRWQPDAHKNWQPTVLKEKSSTVAASAGTMALLDINGDGASELVRSSESGWEVIQITDDKLTPLTAVKNLGVLHWATLTNQVSAGPSIIGLSQENKLLLWQPGRGRHPFLGLSFSGKTEQEHSMRSNASGIGTHAAVRVADRWSIISAFRHSSGPGQSLQPYTLGLGGAAQADFIALEWSDGVFQTELGIASGKSHQLTETQRQLASCPVLYAWDGQNYQFISDILGVGGLGFAIGRGEYAESRPRENFQLPAGLLQPKEGLYLLSLGEPMEEAAYLDNANLSAYDLPPGWQLVLDERMAILGPQASGEPRFYQTEILPKKAINERLQDVTTTITTADLKAAPLGEVDTRFIGRMQKEHSLILEFPQPLDAHVGSPLLVIDGWVEYPYSQTMFAAWQADAAYLAPSLDVWGADGQWHLLLDQFGYPAGMPRRMSVPLEQLPAGTTKLRLRTNQEIYWDRIAVAYAQTPPQLEHHKLPLQSAHVRANGFPLRSNGEQRLPHYDYSQTAPFWDTRHMAGFYTEFGDASGLVEARDDAVAIIGPGEEVLMAFRDTAKPLKNNWSRTFVFESFGWAKDMDLYTRDGNTIEPLPSSGRKSAKRDQLHTQYNTRYRSGN